MYTFSAKCIYDFFQLKYGAINIFQSYNNLIALTKIIKGKIIDNCFDAHKGIKIWIISTYPCNALWANNV